MDLYTNSSFATDAEVSCSHGPGLVLALCSFLPLYACKFPFDGQTVCEKASPSGHTYTLLRQTALWGKGEKGKGKNKKRKVAITYP